MKEAMELDDIKKIWSRLEDRHGQREYSEEEILFFRKARSRDFTGWVRTSIGFDLILKSLLVPFLVVLFLLYLDQPVAWLGCLIAILILTPLIPYEWRIRRLAGRIDQHGGSIQEILTRKVHFLKNMYFKVQFLQSLTYPILVLSGMLMYYHVKYQYLPVFNLKDWLVTSAILILSFLITLPSNLVLYGFHLRNLQGCLSSLTDPEYYQSETSRFDRHRRILSAILYILLISGVLLLGLVAVL